MPNEMLKDGVGSNPLAEIVMPSYSGDIGIEELSPTLQRLILEGNGTGGGNGEPWGAVVRDIITRKVTATTQDQKVFTIPFEDYEEINCHLDIKINSVWLNPDRYTINGLQVTLQDGVDIGKSVYFSCYYLAETTGDGGFIQDVDVAETPQEVIVYDGSIIDEKVTAHNGSGTAHADIRGLIDGKADASRVSVLESNRGYLKTKGLNSQATSKKNDIDNATENGKYTVYVIDDEYLGTGWYNVDVIVHVNGFLTQTATRLTTANGSNTQVKVLYRSMHNSSWQSWREIATTDLTTALDTKIDVLNTNRGYLTTKSLDSGDVYELLKINGNFAGNNLINAPTIGSGSENHWYVYNVVMHPFNNNYGSIIASGYANSPKKTHINTLENGKWLGWQEVATTSKINNLPLLNGWKQVANTPYVNNTPVVKNGNVVTIDIFVEGGGSATGTSIFTLPDGYRPKVQKYVYVVQYPSKTVGVVEISVNGSVWCSDIVENKFPLQITFITE